ncbi:hypothetical protein GCM10010249_59310 [Streptomyces roseolilacinus]|uniref:Uncharacterized protein n=1 Tax=Streptomyces roseolilacinus TaxID=66904 RepID=A0A918B6C6_9ACTN|nr:hypothetical protein GCM10010249_59310 [Streptomyces roseolilacinus]
MVLDGGRADSWCGWIDGRLGDERGGEAGPGEGELDGDVGGDVARCGGKAGLLAGVQNDLFAIGGRRWHGDVVRGQFAQVEGTLVGSVATPMWSASTSWHSS